MNALKKAMWVSLASLFLGCVLWFQYQDYAGRSHVSGVVIYTSAGAHVSNGSSPSLLKATCRLNGKTGVYESSYSTSNNRYFVGDKIELLVKEGRERLDVVQNDFTFWLPCLFASFAYLIFLAGLILYPYVVSGYKGARVSARPAEEA